MIHFGYPHNSEVKSAFCRPRHLDAPDSSVAQSVHDILPHGWADSVETEPTKRFSAGKASFWRMIQKFHENSGMLLRDSCDRHTDRHTEEPKNNYTEAAEEPDTSSPWSHRSLRCQRLRSCPGSSHPETKCFRQKSLESAPTGCEGKSTGNIRKPWCLPCLAPNVMVINGFHSGFLWDFHPLGCKAVTNRFLRFTWICDKALLVDESTRAKTKSRRPL